MLLRRQACETLLGLMSVCFASGLAAGDIGRLNYPPSPERPVVEHLHGIDVVDPYRWLEEKGSAEVAAWTEAQNCLTDSYLEGLPQYPWIQERLRQLARSEHVEVRQVLEGARRFVSHKTAEQEHAVLYCQADATQPLRQLINPNTWRDGRQLQFFEPSRDGAYIAYGVAIDGNECPEIKVMEVESGQILDDTLGGRKQGWPGGLVSWLPDNRGFFYSALPELDEVPKGEEEYWHSAYLHLLGTDANTDRRVFLHPTDREAFHSVTVSETGDYAVLERTVKSCGSEIYIQMLDGSGEAPVALVVAHKQQYKVAFAGEQIVLVTNADAPNFKAYFVDPHNPSADHWTEFLAEGADRLLTVKGVGGFFFAEYLHHAHVVVNMYDVEGKFFNTLPLDTLGTAQVEGCWSQPEVWVYFSSYTHPQSRFRYHTENNMLQEIDAPNLTLDSHRFAVEQVWYPSKDGTLISMFLICDKRASYGQRPVLLTGYGGFGIPITPSFVDHYIPFLEAGGLIAIPNLRGGGEYGEGWHGEGMREKKQNVFDDFIAAAEWLIQYGYTSADRLAVRGRSNGGLLVGAVMTQRPDLFRAVLCEVPLLDMVRYHKFGFANIWSKEYGSAENSDQFRYLYRYSPYHRVKDGISYPAVMVCGAENDARTDVLHVRKMVARLQAADPDGFIKLGRFDKAAGHQGGVNVAARIESKASGLAFLMDQLGMKVPSRLTRDIPKPRCWAFQRKVCNTLPRW